MRQFWNSAARALGRFLLQKQLQQSPTSTGKRRRRSLFARRQKMDRGDLDQSISDTPISDPHVSRHALKRLRKHQARHFVDRQHDSRGRGKQRAYCEVSSPIHRSLPGSPSRESLLSGDPYPAANQSEYPIASSTPSEMIKAAPTTLVNANTTARITCRRTSCSG